jgi:hypothetical protein
MRLKLLCIIVKPTTGVLRAWMPGTSHILVSQGYLTATGSGYREMVSKYISHYYTQGMYFDCICHIGHRADGLYPGPAGTASPTCRTLRAIRPARFAAPETSASRRLSRRP